MKCLPREWFAKDEYLDNLICGLGYGIFNDPVALPCQHVFCRACILSASEGRGCGICPSCGEAWAKEQLRAQIEVAELINQATVKCQLCDWTGQYQALDKHNKASCPSLFVNCQHGCNQLFPRKFLPEHESECIFRKVECRSCQKQFLYKEIQNHEPRCIEKDLECPICKKRIKLYELEIHFRLKHNSTSLCAFSFAGCDFIENGKEKSLEDHYRESEEKHLDLLCTTVEMLQAKLEKLEHECNSSPVQSPYHKAIGPRTYNIKWSDGKVQVAGTKKSGWSFFMSNQTIQGNFIARLRIVALGDDPNTWKMCLGLYNSEKHQAGAWDKFKNGWGYILGNGYKIHTNPSSAYGQSYGSGDNISIEYKSKSIIFYKNGVSQGVAFSDVPGPFFIVAALSDSSHVVELVEVTELLN